jgi:Fe-S cluster biogenesis protein NfuA
MDVLPDPPFPATASFTGGECTAHLPDERYSRIVSGFDELLRRLDELMAELERLEEPLRGRVVELLDGIDAAHRTALRRLPDVLGDEGVARLRAADPALAWLLDAYAVGVAERELAEAALEEIRPYIESHGGEVDVLEAHDGIVRVRLSGSCSGCTASAVTLREGVERALRDGFPAFVALEVEEDAGAEPHPPPGPTLLELENRLG